ncbi:hypothetical protein WJX75_003049 [Coccomyxa subellipsoidea]|uniref:Fungal lipase-type domain-containing protein n=1 Tax=Coccomyxa subellipsoidea TaxID=248742 RepID=A0ABR2YWJ4_9CHLO
MIWTQAAFNNTQVHIALVEEWDPKFKVGGKTVAGVFAFRGTQPWSLSDWIIDFNHDKEPIDWWQPPPTAAPSSHVSEVPNGIYSDDCKTCGPQAHGGFLYAFNSVAERPWPKEFGTATPNFGPKDREKTLDAALLRQIDEYNLLCSDKKGHKTLDATHLTRIICTGHSLGGALATLAAVWARVALVKHIPAAGSLHVSCVTLGSPLVGDKRFAEAFRVLQYNNGKGDADRSPQTLDCTRIYHAMDPVPMVPPAPWGFQHVGRPLWLDKQMTAYTRWYKVYNHNKDLRPLHRSFFVADHFEWRYLVAMDLALANTYVGDSRYSQDVMGQIMDQSLAFLDSTFGIVAGLKQLSVVIKNSITFTHSTITAKSPWGGRLLSKYGGVIWRAFLAPAEVIVFIGTNAISLLDG